MASLDEMLRAGYTPAKSGAEQVATLLNGVSAQEQKQQQKNEQDTADQVKLYTTLREAGYSKEDAATRVGRSYRSTGFLQNLLTGKGNNVFNPGTEEDKVGMEQKKSEADIAAKKAEIPKTEAETNLANKKAKYYDEGGPKRTVIDKMTPNQLQARLKYLQSVQGTMDNTEDNQNIDQEIEFINKKVQEISGFTKAGAGADGAAGEKVGSVVMTGPDGKKYRIPAANVAKAKLRGFK